MNTYISHYIGENSKSIIKDTLITLGMKPKVVIVDTVLDMECLELKNELEDMHYDVEIKDASAFDINDLSDLLTIICKEQQLKAKQTGEDLKIFMELGGLDHISAGAVYNTAFSNSCTIVYIGHDGKLKLKEYEPLPDITKTGYHASKTLDDLYDNDGLDMNEISKSIYAEQIVGMSDEELKAFFNTHHNTYKILNNMEKKKWISYNKKTKKYNITNLGIVARLMIHIKTTNKGSAPSKESFKND